MPSSSRVCAITDTKKRQAEDEQHRVGVDQLVEAVERQQVRRASTPTSRVPAISACHADVGRPTNVATMTSSIP